MTERRADPRPARTRQRVLNAARQLLLHDSLEQITLGDVAARAHVAIGSIYTHFENKDGLVAALVDESLGNALEQLVARREDLAPIERVLAVGQMHLDFALQHPAEALVILGGPPVGRPTAASIRTSRRLAAMGADLEGDIADAIQRKELSSAGDPRSMATFLMVYWAGLALSCARRSGVVLSDAAAHWALEQSLALAQASAGFAADDPMWASTSPDRLRAC